MSKARLKKQLLSLNRDQIAEMVLELYDIRKDAREYLDYWADPDPQKAHDKAIKDVRKVFFSGINPRRKPSLTDLNTVVKNFMTLALDREMTADFLMTVAETEAEWLEHRWRRLSYRSSMLKNLENARIYIENAWPDEQQRHPLTDDEKTPDNPFEIRLERLTEKVRALFYYVR